ncbi:MFS transporter [Alkalicoccobacillus porphyridii]|uniref:MFS transporter n=1 Tax=Alkalicoccobacillus porphyridii TaxID=2597270 RepID=A0A553ZZ59_9BACI|nr:MFS transporter [Alkalicoccobacillus porphyridii]TSB46730.1 MFS transporter [Alkalicoccobacillus porphyridii]
MVKLWVQTIGIGSFTIIMVVGNGLFIPLIPEIQKNLQLNASQASLVLGSFSYAGAIMIPLSSWLSRSYGRKKVLTISLLLLLIGCVLSSTAGFTENLELAYYEILGGRILQGVGAGAAAPMGLILASELYHGSDQIKMISNLEIMNGVAKAISPVCGGLIMLYAWQTGFIWYMALASVSLAVVLFLLRPGNVGTEVVASNKEPINNWKWVSPLFALGFMVMFLLYGLLFIVAALISQSGQRGIFVSLPLAMLVIISYFYGRSNQHSFRQIQRLIYFGIAMLLMSGCIACFHYLSINFTIIASMVVGAAAGILLPASSNLLLMVTPEYCKKKAITWLTMFRFLGVATGPVVFGMWSNQWMEHVFYLIGLVGVLGLVFVVCWQRSGHSHVTMMDTK